MHLDPTSCLLQGAGSAKPFYSKPSLTGPEQEHKCSRYLNTRDGLQGRRNLMRHQQLVEMAHRKLATECGVEALSVDVYGDLPPSGAPWHTLQTRSVEIMLV